jgi:hypothetical protein
MPLTIINKSQWQDLWVETVVRWIWRRLNRRDPRAAAYVFTVRAPSETRDVHGRAGRVNGFMRLGRRAKSFRHLQRDRRFAWAPEYPVDGALEAFVFLAAHELRHGHVDNHALWSTGRAQGAEHDANHWAAETLAAFKLEWPAIRAAMLATARNARADAKAKAAREAERKAAKNSPETKLARVLELKAQWQTKAKRAANKLKTLNRREAALRRSIDKRAAAKG